MATNALVPHDPIAALTKKHFTITYGFMAIVLVIVMTMGYFGMKSLQSFNMALAKNEARYEQYEANAKQLQGQIDANNAQISNLSKTQGTVQRGVDSRNKSTDKKIAEITARNVTMSQAIDNITKAYQWPTAPVLDPTGTLAQLNQQQTEDATVAKVDRDRLAENLTNTQQILTLEQDKNKLATDSLGKSEEKAKTCQAQLDDTRKIVVKSKWQKFTAGAGKVITFGLGVLAGKGLAAII